MGSFLKQMYMLKQRSGNKIKSRIFRTESLLSIALLQMRIWGFGVSMAKPSIMSWTDIIKVSFVLPRLKWQFLVQSFNWQPPAVLCCSTVRDSSFSCSICLSTDQIAMRVWIIPVPQIVNSKEFIWRIASSRVCRSLIYSGKSDQSEGGLGCKSMRA